eukprot:1139335-Pelagomonas_calceolata.AAC.1
MPFLSRSTNPRPVKSYELSMLCATMVQFLEGLAWQDRAGEQNGKKGQKLQLKPYKSKYYQWPGLWSKRGSLPCDKLQMLFFRVCTFPMGVPPHTPMLSPSALPQNLTLQHASEQHRASPQANFSVLLNARDKEACYARKTEWCTFARAIMAY